MNKMGISFIVLAIVLLFSTCDNGGSSSGASGNGLSFSISGDRSDSISFDRVYASETGTDDVSVTFSTYGEAWPNMQLNIRNTDTIVGTHYGAEYVLGSSVHSADLSLAYGASTDNFYTTFDTQNFTVTITQFSYDEGIKGYFSITDGGVLSIQDYSTATPSSITVTPNSNIPFECSFVYQWGSDDYPLPEPIN